MLHTPPWLVREGVIVYFERVGLTALAEKARKMDDNQIDRLNTALCKALSAQDWMDEAAQ